MLLSEEVSTTSDYYFYNGQMYSADELKHYGVLGMKWGHRKALRKAAANDRLIKKAYKYDKREAVLTKKSEKMHAKYDLETKNKAATKAARYAKKSAVLNTRALKAETESERVRLENKAAKMDYKSSKAKLKANRLSKTTGYGVKAMKYSIKSDKVAIKSAKARAKIASNKAYIDSMNRKMSSLSKDELRKVEQPLSQMIAERIKGGNA